MKRFTILFLLLILSSTSVFAKNLDVILLDESGSMQVRQKETVDAINKLFKDLRKKNKSDVIFARFDSERFTINKEPILASDLGGLEDYKPGAGTPLNDSTVRIIRAAEKFEEKYSKVIFSVLTDGEENESKEFTEKDVRDLLEKKAGDDWKINYFSIKQDENDFQAYNYGQRNFSNAVFVSGGKSVSSDAVATLTAYISTDKQ